DHCSNEQKADDCQEAERQHADKEEEQREERGDHQNACDVPQVDEGSIHHVSPHSRTTVSPCDTILNPPLRARASSQRSRPSKPSAISQSRAACFPLVSGIKPR